MIDIDLINQNIAQLTNSISNRKSLIVDHVHEVTDCFDKEIIDKLWDYLQQPNLNWTTAKLQEKLPRQSIQWDADTVIEELHTACDGITSLLSTIYKIDLQFLGNQLWRDQQNYFIDWHQDNSVIAVALQIYLFDTSQKFGTSFADRQGVEYHVPFKHNSGYLINQTDYSCKHKTTNIFNENGSRYSLYSIWQRRTTG